MKLLFDLFPVLLFFIAFKLGHSYPAQAQDLAGSLLGPLVTGGVIPAGQGPILIATAVAILASLLQVLWLVARGKKVEPMLWVSLVVIVVFGGATIWLHDETFIKWKPSILYVLFAAALVGTRFLAQRNLLKNLLGAQMTLPEQVWERLLWLWSSFFVAVAGINLIVAYSVPTETWVNFKLFGLLGFTFAFTLGIGLWLSRYLKEAR